MGLMGWMGRIGEWWGRRRVLSRQVARQALTITELEGALRARKGQIRSMQAVTSGETEDLRRRLAVSEAACAELREIVAGRPTDGELSRELARMLTTVDILGCKIDGLATRLARPAGGPEPPDEEVDCWQVATGDMTVRLRPPNGGTVGLTMELLTPESVCVWRAIPVSGRMERALREFLERLAASRLGGEQISGTVAEMRRSVGSQERASMSGTLSPSGRGSSVTGHDKPP